MKPARDTNSEPGLPVEELVGVYERIHRFNSKWGRREEREIREFEMDFKKSSLFSSSF